MKDIKDTKDDIYIHHKDLKHKEQKHAHHEEVEKMHDIKGPTHVSSSQDKVTSGIENHEFMNFKK